MKIFRTLFLDFTIFLGYVFLGWPVKKIETERILNRSFLWIITSWFISAWLGYIYYQAVNLGVPKIIIACLIPVLLIFLERGRSLSIIIKEKSLTKILTLFTWCIITAYAIYITKTPEYLILFLAPILFYLRSLQLIINYKILPIAPKTNLKIFLLSTLIFYSIFYASLIFLISSEVSLIIVSSTFVLMVYFIIYQTIYPKKNFSIDSVFYSTFHLCAIYIIIYNFLQIFFSLR